MKRIHPLAGAFLLIPLALGACGPGETPASQPGSSAAGGSPAPGGTLRFGHQVVVTVLDPTHAANYAEGIIATNTADRLTYQDPSTGEITPWLAESWEVSDDVTTFTFHLRDGVTFSDGTPFTAASVKENYDLLGLGDDALGIPALVELFDGYKSAEVIDDKTVTISFEQPAAGFLSATAHFNAGLLGSSYLALDKEARLDWARVVSTGPFAISAFEPQVKTVLTKRADYAWAPPALGDAGPNLDAIELYVIAEGTARTGSLRADEVDAILDVQPTDEAPLVADGFTLTSALVPGENFTLDLRVDAPPTNDPAVRQALQIGWDRQGLAKTVLTPTYPVATSVIAANVAGHKDYSGSALRYDKDAAIKLLEDAGWAAGSDGIRTNGGQRLSLEILAVSADVANKAALEYFQQQAIDLGVEVNLTIVDFTEFLNEVNIPGTYNAVFSVQTRNDVSVIDEIFSPARSNASFLAASDEGYQETIDVLGKLNTVTELASRNEAAAAAQELVLSTHTLAVPFFTNGQVIAANSRVHGLAFDANARASFLGTWIEA
jgi:peptide/nickel transport system substrate-binding protein